MNKETKDKLIALSTLYLLIATAEKESLSIKAAEIFVKLKEWIQNIEEDELLSIVKEADELITDKDHLELAIFYGETINKTFDEDNKINVLRDLIDLALMDGKINKPELIIINFLANAWELLDRIDIDEYVQKVKTSNSLESSDGYFKEEGLTESKIESVIISDQDILTWSVIHDILTVLIFTGSQSRNNNTDLEWEVIYLNIAKSNLTIGHRSYNLTNYTSEEIAKMVDVVIEKMWGNEDNPQDPSVYFQDSVQNIINFYKNGDLDQTNISTIIKLMFDVSIADDFITDSQKYILEFIIKIFIPSIPTLEKINDLIKMQITKQNLKNELVSEPDILEMGGSKINPKTGKMEFTLSTFKEAETMSSEELEIIAEVFKVDNTYRARKKGTNEDITEIISNPAKLKYAFERSGLIKGKKDKMGNYVWRVMG